MDIRQISQRQDITGMVTMKHGLFFFTKDGLYFIEMPEKEPWYRRVWAWFRAGWKEYQQYLKGGRP